MKVSERSWHLRFVRFTRLHLLEQWYAPHDLCSYFWGGIVGALLLWACLLVLAVALTCVVLGGIAAPFVLVFLALKGDVAARIMASVLAVGALALWMVHRGRHARARQPNLLIEYLRAKKRRICPLIEVVNDD